MSPSPTPRTVLGRLLVLAGVIGLGRLPRHGLRGRHRRHRLLRARGAAPARRQVLLLPQRLGQEDQGQPAPRHLRRHARRRRVRQAGGGPGQAREQPDHHRGAPQHRGPGDAAQGGGQAQQPGAGRPREVGGDGRAAPRGQRRRGGPGGRQGRADGQGQGVLVVQAARRGRRAAGRRRLGGRRHRPLHRRRSQGQGPDPDARRRPPHAHPPRHLRPHRAAADAGRDRGLRRRPGSGRLRAAGRPPARLAALRRAVGPPLAGCGALRRHRRRQRRLPGAAGVALPRLGDLGLQPRPALRPLHPRPDRRRPAAGGGRR